MGTQPGSTPPLCCCHSPGSYLLCNVSTSTDCRPILTDCALSPWTLSSSRRPYFCCFLSIYGVPLVRFIYRLLTPEGFPNILQQYLESRNHQPTRHYAKRLPHYRIGKKQNIETAEILWTTQEQNGLGLTVKREQGWVSEDLESKHQVTHYSHLRERGLGEGVEMAGHNSSNCYLHFQHKLLSSNDT